MGRKRPWAGQFIYLFSAGVILSILFGCLPEMRRVAVQKAPAIPDLREGQDVGDKPWESLQRARILFGQGDYEGSFTENQKILEWAGKNSPADRALFNMGLIYAYGGNPKRDPEKSMEYFRRVAEEFSQSPLAEESKAWLGLLQKNLDLTQDVVDLTQENVALLQEIARLSQMPEKSKLREETALSTRDHFHRARNFLEQGNFEAALDENQKVLSTPGKNTSKDRALFQIGLIYAASRNPKRDFDKSLSFFLRLVKEYPQSPFTDEAKIWIDLLQENQKLNRMIEKSKEVDIAIEEKKREKGR